MIRKIIMDCVDVQRLLNIYETLFGFSYLYEEDQAVFKTKSKHSSQPADIQKMAVEYRQQRSISGQCSDEKSLYQ